MQPMVKVWDPLVRLFHWGLAGSFVVAWASADSMHALHLWSGYAAGGLICLRLVIGLRGSRYARFRQFLRSPTRIIRYSADLFSKRHRRYLGHSPVGGLMVLVMIVATALVALTGFLQTTEAFSSAAWMAGLHERLAHVLLGSVLMHLVGVLFASLRRRENLVAAMITGRKRAPGQGDVA